MNRPFFPRPEGSNSLTLPPDMPAWSGRDTLIGVLATLVPLLLLNLSLRGGSLTKPLSPTQDSVVAVVQFIFAGALEAVFIIAPLYYARRRAGGAALDQLGFRSTNLWMALGLIVLAQVLTLVLGYAFDILSQAIFHIVPQSNLDELIKQIHFAPRTTVATVLVAVLCAPPFEEIFFRGFLMQGLRRVIPDGWAIVASAAIFALAHLSPGSTLLLFILGLMLGYLRVTTRSLWPGIGLHMLNNTLGLIQVLVIVAGH